MIPRCSPILLLVLLLLIAGPTRGQAEDRFVPPLAPLIENPASEMATVVDRWSSDRRGVLNRFPFGYSAARGERLESFTRAWRDRLSAVEFDALSPEGKIDYLLLDNELRSDLARLDRTRRQFAEMEPLMPFAPLVVELLEARKRLDPLDPEAAADVLTRVTSQVDDLRKGVDEKKKEGKVARTVAFRAAGAVDELRGDLSQWFRHYDGYDPMFTWWNRDPFKKTDESLKDYARALRETLADMKDPDAIIGDPIGREGLMEDLRAEMIDYTPEELIAIGEREFLWCEAEMKKASNEMGFGDDWKSALEKVKTLHVKPGEQPALVKQLADESVAFLEKNDLITIPALAKEDWPLDMMSPEAQKVNPFFLGGDRIIVSYPTDRMDYSDKKMSVRSNNIHFSRATVHHELIPGHHLQAFMNDRFNTHRRVFGTPFWTEGWALYWEMVLWDKGFPRSPEDRVGMLFWRMHRCARIIFSLKFHLGQMTPEEAITFLVDRVGHEKFSATGEVRRSFRGDYSPLYQAAYMLGGMQIRALRKELVESGKMSEKQFHDKILLGNTMPIEMVRARVSGVPLKRDHEVKWKFGGEGLIKKDEADDKP